MIKYIEIDKKDDRRKLNDLFCLWFFFTILFHIKRLNFFDKDFY